MKKLILILILFIPFIVFSQSERSLIKKGNNLYETGKYTDAEINYRKSLDKNKDSYHGTFNLGDALYKQEKYDEAGEQFITTANNKNVDNEIKAKAYHNLGNSLFQKKKYDESIAAYKNALKLYPKDADTKYNLEMAKRMLLKQQQQQQQQQNQQDQNDKKDEKKENESEKNKDQQPDQDQKNKQDQKNDGNKEQAKEQEQPKQNAGQRENKLSKEDAERILEALKNDEQEVQKKLHKGKAVKTQVEKDW